MANGGQGRKRKGKTVRGGKGKENGELGEENEKQVQGKEKQRRKN
jgi:hypothetical protein